MPRVAKMDLSGGALLTDRVPSRNYPNAIIINRPSDIRYLKASSSTEQQYWLADISSRANFTADDVSYTDAIFKL